MTRFESGDGGGLVLQISQVYKGSETLLNSHYIKGLIFFHALTAFCTASLNLRVMLHRFVMDDLWSLLLIWDTHTNHCCPSVLHSCGTLIFSPDSFLISRNIVQHYFSLYHSCFTHFVATLLLQHSSTGCIRQCFLAEMCPFVQYKATAF